MKNSIVILLLLLAGVTAFSQNKGYELPARQTPAVSKETLRQANYINELSPVLWANLNFPQHEMYWLRQRRINNYVQPQPADYPYPQEDYKLILQVVYLKIAATCNGKWETAVSSSDKLSSEQKDILSRADMGSDISVTLKYKYKDQRKDSYGSRTAIVEGSANVTIVPDTEAEYPGGWKQLSEYFKSSVINKISAPDAADKVFMAIVKFTVSEDGQIMNAGLERSTKDAAIDKLLLDAMNKMPKWKPAQNSKGVKVKQEMSIPFSAGC